MDMQKKLVWDAEQNFLALWRPDQNRMVAQVRKIDRSRWLAFVMYDAPGTGAACVRAGRTAAIEWIEETVKAAWPADGSAIAEASAELHALPHLEVRQ